MALYGVAQVLLLACQSGAIVLSTHCGCDMFAGQVFSVRRSVYIKKRLQTQTTCYRSIKGIVAGLQDPDISNKYAQVLTLALAAHLRHGCFC